MMEVMGYAGWPLPFAEVSLLSFRPREQTTSLLYSTATVEVNLS